MLRWQVKHLTIRVIRGLWPQRRSQVRAHARVVSRFSVLNFLAGCAANTRVGGFVRAVRCLGKVQTEIAFSVSLLVVCCSLIIYRLRSALYGSQAAKVSCLRGKF
jgi:hypothetical protein